MVVDIKLIFQNGQPLFKSGKYTGILLAFDAKEGEVIDTPGDPDGDKDMYWGYFRFVLHSKQNLLPSSTTANRVGRVGWRGNGIKPQTVDGLAWKINWLTIWGREASLGRLFAGVCKEYYMLPPFQKWKGVYDYVPYEYSEMIKSKSRFNNGFTATEVDYSQFFMESGQQTLSK